jgi:demethylmenaquinone methyltransferase/2-methoxy-6-polyprenyl-1,4-benzoquinol methylase
MTARNRKTPNIPTGNPSFVHTVFSNPKVSSTYELANHILTFGFDILWRKRAARIAAKASPGQWADMCTGTGEMAIYLSRLAPEQATIHAIDFSESMLARAAQKPHTDNINFTTADVTSLPFPDDTFDLITMSFATRNINLNKEKLIQTFAEFHRVLKPNGIFVNLETSQPAFAPLRMCFHLYIKLFVQKIGTLISKTKTPYTYLATTIPRFYNTEELTEILHQAGFANVTAKKLFLSIAAIHQARKT